MFSSCQSKLNTQTAANGRGHQWRSVTALERFASVHSSVFNHFNKDRHLNRRDIFKTNRDAALAEWPQLGPA